MAIETFNLSTLPGKSSDTGRRSSVLFELLQQQIVLGILPPMSVVLELDLAQRFGYSQSTVREALLALQQEGLVHRRPHRGTQISPCTEQEAIEMIHIRHDIECRAITRVLDLPGSERDQLRTLLLKDITAMTDAARNGDEYLLSCHDRSFHLRLYHCANLPNVEPILKRCLVHNHRYKILHCGGGDPARLLATAERHHLLIDAIDSGDRDKLISCLSQHIRTAVDFGPDLTRPETEKA